MPFISNEAIKQKAEKIKFDERVESKKEVQKINDVANRVDPKAPLKDKDLIELANESRKYQDRTLKDIQEMEGLKQMMIEKKEEEIEKLLDNREMREIKGEIVSVLAIPHTNPDKR